MDLAPEVIDLIRRTADNFPWGPARRRFMADTLRKALHERRTGLTCRDANPCRGPKPSEAQLPRLLDDPSTVRSWARPFRF